MSDECTLGLDDVRYDIEGVQKAAARFAAFDARAEEAARARPFGRGRGVRTRGVSAAGVGRRLVQACLPATQRRYQTLLFLEEQFPADGDYGLLIGPASQILEAELDRLVATPARTIRHALLAGLDPVRDRNPAAALEKWAAAQVPTTMGIEALVLLALRRGCEQGVGRVRAFLAERFTPVYVKLLTGRQLGTCLEEVRTRFRNPACHATETFDPAAYERFAQLMVAARRFALWDRREAGPNDPDEEVGVLHQHLKQALPSAPT